MNLGACSDGERRHKWNADPSWAVPEAASDAEVQWVARAWRADKASVPATNPVGMKWRWELDEDTARHVASNHRLWLEGAFVRRVLDLGACPVRMNSREPVHFAVLSIVVDADLRQSMKPIAEGGTLLLALAVAVESLAGVPDGAVVIGGG